MMQATLPISLHSDLNATERRKISDVFTNLSLRMKVRLIASHGSEHMIEKEEGNLYWATAGTRNSALTVALRHATEILSFRHLNTDPDFPDRVRYAADFDVETPFLERIFAQMADALGHPLILESASTGPAKRIVQISHDIDNPQLMTPYQLGRAALLHLRGMTAEGAILRAAFRTSILRKADPFWCFDNIRQRAQVHEFRSTFFAYSAYNKPHPRDPRYRVTSPRYRNELERLSREGHEIGLHSGILYNDFTKKRAPLPGDPIQSHRAHYWALPPGQIEQWYDTMAQAGITSDASLSPHCSGFAMGAIYPLQFTTISGETLLIHPSQFMDAYQVAQDRSQAILKAIDACAIADLPPVINLNWHIRVFSGIGPWAGYPESFDALLSTLLHRYSVLFHTVSQSFEFFKKPMNASVFQT